MQSDSFTTYIHSKVKAFQMALISIEQKRRKNSFAFNVDK